LPLGIPNVQGFDALFYVEPREFERVVARRFEHSSAALIAEFSTCRGYQCSAQ
jgi:hypothetical protein